MDSGVSPGEAGGVIAGAIAILAALGKGMAWLLNWQGARADARAARLKVWEESLDRREREHREKTEGRLKAMESKVSAVSAALFEAIGELQRLDPASPVLAKARQVLQAEFPVDPELSDEMKALLRRLDGAREGDKP